MAACDYQDEIKQKGLTAPRVTPERLEEVMVTASYHVFPGTTVTVCCITLRNGFTVVGESACADPKNFDAELGRKIAYDNAKNKIWALEGYLLRQWLYENQPVRGAGSAEQGAYTGATA